MSNEDRKRCMLMFNMFKRELYKKKSCLHPKVRRTEHFEKNRTRSPVRSVARDGQALGRYRRVSEQISILSPNCVEQQTRTLRASACTHLTPLEFNVLLPARFGHSWAASHDRGLSLINSRGWNAGKCFHCHQNCWTCTCAAGNSNVNFRFNLFSCKLEFNNNEFF